MTRVLRYLSHPQVTVDAAVPVPQWGLSELGRQRAQSIGARPSLAATRHVFCSDETKAIETAELLAGPLGLAAEQRLDMHENDRSATGFLPPAEFETVADRFFAEPDTSVRGWETARAAQHRIVNEVRDCLRLHPDGDMLIVGHGGVGTLLYCHLAGLPISRTHDQGPGGGGCVFAFAEMDGPPHGPWQPMETLVPPRD